MRPSLARITTIPSPAWPQSYTGIIAFYVRNRKHETLEHLFYEFPAVKPLLHQTQHLISQFKGSPYTLSLQHMICNICENKKNIYTLICNYLINVTRYTIWSARNICKFESRTVDLKTWARLCIKERLNIEHFIYLHKRNDPTGFANSWFHREALCMLVDNNLVQLL